MGVLARSRGGKLLGAGKDRYTGRRGQDQVTVSGQTKQCRLALGGFLRNAFTCRCDRLPNSGLNQFENFLDKSRGRRSPFFQLIDEASLDSESFLCFHFAIVGKLAFGPLAGCLLIERQQM